MKKRLGRMWSWFFVLAAASSFVFAQSAENEKTRINDFGASLKPGFSKSDEKSKNKAIDAADEDVIRIETELVLSDVMVLDRKGRRIKGLTRGDFIVREDGSEQTIEAFSEGDGAGAVPRSIVLVMDYSGSLLPYIKTSVAAAKTLVDKLRPQDRMAIVTDDVELLTGFTRDKKSLKDKLDQLEKNVSARKTGRSWQYSALFAALNELFDAEDARPIVIFQTDGDEFRFLKGNFIPPARETPANRRAEYGDTERLFSYADVLTAAERARATVYTIIPGLRFIGLSPQEQIERARAAYETRNKTLTEFFNRPVMPGPADKEAERLLPRIRDLALQMHTPIDALAKFTGGWADYLETPEQADEVYSRVLADIDNRYLIGYYPTNQMRDGKRRKVKIEVRRHPEYIVWGRKAYYAPRAK